MAIRKCFQDTILTREVHNQRLSIFLFRCLELHASDPQFRDLLLYCLFEFAKPELTTSKCQHEQAYAGTAKLVHLIPDYVDNPQMLQVLLGTLHRYLYSFGSVPHTTGSSADLSVLEYLELPLLVESLIPLIDSAKSPGLLSWETVDHVSGILSWIAYHQSSAFEGPESADLLSVFAAFLLSPSPSIRCRGLLGLLNYHSPDYIRHIRLCDPRIVARVLSTVDADKRFQGGLSTVLPIFTPESIRKRYHNPSVKTYCDGSPFNTYEAALRIAEFELHGPRDASESFAYPFFRLFGGLLWNIDAPLVDDLEAALRFHKKDFEADVVRMAMLNLISRALVTAGGPGSLSGTLYATNLARKRAAADGMRRWPDHYYFYYSTVASQTGIRNHEIVLRGLACKGNPHLRTLMMYESALNLFNMAVTFLALTPFGGPIWETGAQHLKEAEICAVVTLELLKPDVAEHYILRNISCLIRIITRVPTFGSCRLSTLMDELGSTSSTLLSEKCLLFPELSRATNDFLALYPITLKTWLPLITRMEAMEHVIREDAEFVSIYRRTSSDDQIYRTLPSLEREELCCAWCSGYSVGLKKCSRCGKVKYCGKECQAAHWKAGHKAKCISPEISI
ncbi:hypothetical protein SISSUDRAFT_412808 [Sistotremastrum suecicum HHB10207 ss-3]|uniref:phytol kinase n=1 Tax=Sistotremastrum suecicum HHB10207 ss-3 TaxID=1314776 RepID=A0A166FNB7_9AGAM|nr:hypothetical protein SISSUDRAFT_412808 [Sistotremastrum suecicum HHB10207 ss-3]